MEIGEEELAIINKMAARHKKDRAMYNIEDGIWQGGRLETLPSGIDAVLSLENQAPAWQEDKIFVWIPVDDGPFPGLKWLQMVVNIIEDLRSGGKKVYIHCKAGVSRSVMVAAAYLMKLYRWNHDDALNHIAAVNAKINPNPRFMQGLKDWQKYLNIS